MRHDIKRAVVACSLIAAVLVVARPAASQSGWQGFAVTQAPSVVSGGDSPSWGLGVTEDLGGPLPDVWNNNHGNTSEALIDFMGASPSSQTSIQAGDPTTSGPDTHGVAFSDIDGDGDEDLFEVSGRNNNNRLFRNDNGSLTFVNAGGLEDFFGRGRQPLFVDFDTDGDMDVIVANLDLRSAPVPPGEQQLKPSELYLNNGNGTSWTKLADPSEIMSDGHIRIASLTSTGPTQPQIIVTHDVFNLAKDSIAVGTGVFAEPSNPAIPRNNVNLPIREVLVADFDNDLHPEFLAVHGSENATAGIWPLVAYEVSSAGSARQVTLPIDPLVDNCRSAAAADFDNDGDIDILAGCAQRQQGQNRNVVLLNDGVGNFSIAGTDILPATIAETPGAIVTGDFDQNGWMDAFVANGYDFDIAVDHVLMNEGGSGNHWLEIDLVGSNPDAAGAQVFVGGDSWQVRETGHRGHRSQDGRTLHFGLGSSSSIAPIEIMWPDGIFQTCTVSGIDRRVTITKGSPSCQAQTKAGLLAALAADPDTGPPPPPPQFCMGRIVTVSLSMGQSPTEGNDVILGTADADVINAFGGNDVICALGGPDTVNAGAGNDRVQGDGGNDTIDGGSGRDVLQGGGGNDVIVGGTANDRISGNAGADELRGSNGRDRISGNAGPDSLFGGGGNDRLFGNAGVDSANGGVGIDRCSSVESRSGCEVD